MRFKILFLMLFCCLLSIQAFAVDQSDECASWLVFFKAEKSEDMTKFNDRAELISALQSRCTRNIESLDTRLELKPLWISNAAVVTASAKEVARLAENDNVDHVAPDRYRQFIRPGIDWNPSEGAVCKGPVWSVEKVNAPKVWSEYGLDGSGVVVGIIDSGIYEAHPALKGKVLKWKDFSPAQKDEPYDEQGHGTHVAGSIVGGNGVGVAPGARLIVAKVFDKTGNAMDSWVLAAMQWVMDPDGNPNTNDGPRLVNNSWGEDKNPDKTYWAASRAWQAAGILPVFAAGNSGPNGKVAVPANYPHCWAVGATTKSDVKAHFSSIGPIVWDGVTLTKPDIAAPGFQVYSCSKTGGMIYNSGTSMACPHVAGLAALMFQAKPKMSLLQVRSIAESTSIDLGEAGKDNYYGSGRFDAFACISKVKNVVRLAENFGAYEELLNSEKALIGVGPVSPLARPVAESLVKQAAELDEGEFRALAGEFEQGTPASLLVNQARQLRTAKTLHN